MEYIELGQIVNTHGLRGSVKVNVFSENLENIKKYKNIYLKNKDNEYIEYRVLDIKFTNNQAIVTFEEITNKDEANSYRNRYLYIKREDLEELDDDTYYLIDLIGLNAYEIIKNEEKLLGELIEVNQNAPTDIYVIKKTDNKNLMIPAIKEYIKKIDILNKKIIVDLSEYEI